MIKLYNLDEVEDITLWHYLDVMKLPDILNGKLWMTRADYFYDSDHNECKTGFFPAFMQTFFLKSLINAIPTIPLFKELMSELPADLMKISDTNRPAKSFIKCFYMGENESSFMWQNYATKNGVVIKTSLKRLIKALAVNSTLDITVGRVKYQTLEAVENYADELNIVMSKRPYFSNENELRVLLHQERELNLFQEDNGKIRVENIIPKQKGIKIDIDPMELIEEIIVSKTSLNDGLTDKDNIVHDDALSYVKSLVNQSNCGGTNWSVPIKYSEYEIIEVDKNNLRLNLQVDESELGQKWAHLKYKTEEGAALREAFANFFKENPTSDCTLYIVYDKNTGETEGSARLDRPDKLEDHQSYFEIENKEYSKLLSEPDGWGKHYKVNLETGKLERID